MGAWVGGEGNGQNGREKEESTQINVMIPGKRKIKNSVVSSFP